ncbi:MAG: 4-hydroxy-3-methylbut-2-enyl diphosphate reductase, partial [Thermoguttaceae bacterium]|nr:4-hydroxy-3-methylbut-2-enyl diphosphate reductase [Thermoguttaceae bacterium]
MKILLASPLGFCAGVKRAVLALDEALAAGSGPIWALHEIVHNASV